MLLWLKRNCSLCDDHFIIGLLIHKLVHNYWSVKTNIALPTVRIELTTAGLQDQCSATELSRLINNQFTVL